MRKVTSCVSGAALSLMLMAGAAYGQATIQIGSVEESGSIEVTLANGGLDIAGTENTIEFGPEAQLSNCVVNPAINKTASAFSFGPAGCTAGTDCETMKALILSFTDLSAIADGAVLYTCDASAAGAPAGDYALTCTGPGGSDPAGNSVDTNCTDGAVTIPDVPVAQIVVEDVVAMPTGTAQISVSLNLLSASAQVAGTENVIGFESATQLSNCVVNPDINKTASAFSFGPSGCAAGSDCETVKALILSFTDLSAIADDSILFTCDIGLGGGTAAATTSGLTGTFPVTCSEAGGSDPDGNPLFIECVDGSITIEEPPTPVPTATATQTDVPTAVATDTPVEIDTATPRPTSTRPSGTNVDDDSCAIVAPESSSSGWMLLMPMAALLWLRRRNR